MSQNARAQASLAKVARVAQAVGKRALAQPPGTNTIPI